MEDLAKLHCSPVAANTPRLATREIKRLCAEQPDWAVHAKRGELLLKKSYRFEDFDHAVDFTNQVAQFADQEDHHPAILIEWGKVTVSWWAHKINGLHMNDFIMAAKKPSDFIHGDSNSPRKCILCKKY